MTRKGSKLQPAFFSGAIKNGLLVTRICSLIDNFHVNQSLNKLNVRNIIIGLYNTQLVIS